MDRSESNPGSQVKDAGGANAAPRAGAATAETLRRHERMTFGARVVLYELSTDFVPGPPAQAEGADLSRSGLGVRSRRMYYTDRVVLVRIPLRCGGAYFKCGVIRSSVYAGSGLYHVGIEFREMPPGDGLASWMRARQTSADDSR